MCFIVYLSNSNQFNPGTSLPHAQADTFPQLGSGSEESPDPLTPENIECLPNKAVVWSSEQEMGTCSAELGLNREHGNIPDPGL